MQWPALHEAQKCSPTGNQRYMEWKTGTIGTGRPFGFFSVHEISRLLSIFHTPSVGLNLGTEASLVL